MGFDVVEYSKKRKEEEEEKNGIATSEIAGGFDVVEYSKSKNAPSVMEDLKIRLQNLYESNNSLISSYNSRYYDEGGNYITQYRSDYDDWLNSVSQVRSTALKESTELRNILNDYKGYMDDESYVEINKFLDDFSSSFDSLYKSASEEKKYYSQFKTEDDYNKAKADQEERTVLSGYDLNGLARDINDLESVYSEATEYDKASKGGDRSNLVLRDSTLRKRGYKSIEDLRADIDAKRERYNKAYVIQKRNSIDPNSEQSSLGWEKYLADDKKAKNEKKKGYESQSFLERMGYYLGGVQDTSLPGVAEMNVVTEAYRNDDSYRRPNDDWSEEQKGVFGSLYFDDPEEAYKYAEDVNASINRAKEEESLKAIADAAANSGFWAGAGHTVGAIATAPFGLADFMNDVAKANAGVPITADGHVSPFEYSQAVKQGISSELNEYSGTLDEDIPIIGGKGLGDVYGLVTSTAQSAASIPLGELGILISYFGQGAAAGVDEALARGASEDQAMLYGMSLGVFEGVAEKIGIDNLFKLGSTSTFKGFIKNILKQAGAEGMEEGLTSLLSNIADNAIMQDKSNFNLAVEKYMAEGMSEQEAKKKAWMDSVEGIAFDTIAGAASGGLSGGTRTAIVNVFSNHKAKQLYGDGADLVAEAHEIGGDAGVLAEQYQKKLDKGKSLSGGQINRLVEANEMSLKKQDASKMSAATEARLTELGETGDVYAIAEAVVKQAMGEKLTSSEKSLLKNSQYGQRVANEISPENISSGAYTSEWAENIGTERINTKAYNRNSVETQENAAEVLTSKHEELKLAAKDEVSKAKTFDKTTGETVANFKEFSDISQDGKVKKLRLEDGSEIDAKNLNIGRNSDAYIVEGLLNMTVDNVHLDAGTANVLLKEMRNSINAPLSNKAAFNNLTAMIAGTRESLTYGYYGYDQKELMRENGMASEISDSLRNTAYVLGKSLGKERKASDQAKINAAIEARQQNGVEKAEAKGKLRFAEGEQSVLAGLSSDQKAVVDFFRDIAVATPSGMRLVGYSKDYNGYTNMTTGEMVFSLDSNASRDPVAAVLFTAGHESGHYIKLHNPQGFQRLGVFLAQEYGKKGESVHARVLAMQNKSKNNLTYDEAHEEWVCQSLQRMFASVINNKDSGVLQRLQQFDNKVAQLLYKALSKLASKISSLLEKLTPGTFEEQFVAEMDATARKLFESMYAEELVTAIDNAQWLSGVDVMNDILGNKSIEVGKNSLQEMNRRQTRFQEKTEYEAQPKEIITVGTEAKKPKANRKTLGGINARGEINEISIAGKTFGGDVSVKELRDARFKENGFSKKEIDKHNEFIQHMADMMKEARVKYRFIGLDDIYNAKILVSPTSGEIVLSALVNNGDYPINFDFTKICKKRVALQQIVDQLAREKGKKNSDGTVTEVNLSPENIKAINDILADAGIETACLCCFVESKRYNIQSLIQENVIDVWNSLVDEFDSNAGYFNFADESVNESKIPDKEFDALYEQIVAWRKQKGKSSIPKEKMQQFLETTPAARKKLRFSDLVTEKGRTNLHKLYPDIEGLIGSTLGTAAPKSVEAFAPYNGEIDLMESTGETGMREYLFSIAGARSQSFSDFMIAHIFDVVQKTASLSARKFPAHVYTKEIARARLFGMTGEKHNMSILFNIDPEVDSWNAGLKKDGTYFLSDYKAYKSGESQYIQSIGWDEAVNLQNTDGYSKDCGIIAVGFSYNNMIKIHNDPDVRQVIGYHTSSLPAVVKPLTNLDKATDYTPVQNTLAFVGFVKPMYAIPEGVPSYATPPQDVTPIKGDAKTQKVNDTFDIKATFNKLAKGKKGKARTQAAKETLRQILEYAESNGLALKTKKAEGGHGDFDLYSDVAKTKNPYMSADHYIEYCIERGLLPAFFEFSMNPNYYKDIFDFNVFDRLSYNPETGLHEDSDGRQAYAPQTAVHMLNEDGSYAFPSDFFEIVDKQMKNYDEYSQMVEAKMPSVMEAITSIDGMTSNLKFQFRMETDSQKISEAENLEKSGASRKAIWDKHGIIRDAGGHWVTEFSDKFARIYPRKDATGEIPTGTIRLKNIFKHPELYTRFPEAAEIAINLDIPESSTTYASYNRNTNTISVKESFLEKGNNYNRKRDLLHEIQHFIQHQEGRPRGASVKYYESLGMSHEEAVKAYLYTAGEIEARMTADRMDRDDSNRRTEVPDYQWGKAKIRYQDRDSEGNTLSEGQQEFFKDSKVRDKNGKLMVVYHGTDADFTVFERKKGYRSIALGMNYEVEAKGFFFATDYDFASEYGKKVGAYYINVRKPLVTDTSSINLNNLDANGKTRFYDNERVDELYHIFEPVIRDVIERDSSYALYEDTEENIKLKKRWALKDLWSYYDGDIFNNMSIPWEMVDSKHFDECLLRMAELGYDGFMVDEGDGKQGSWFVADSNQAKLTTNLNPTSDPDIRYQERDSDGHKLTEEQEEYFKHSKVRDEKGRLLAVYHGTKKAGFTIFSKTDEIGYFFARHLRTSRTYADNSKKVYAPDRNNAEAPSKNANYKVYLNLENPYIFDGKGANWNSLMASGKEVAISIKMNKWNGYKDTGYGVIKFGYGGKTYKKVFHKLAEFKSFVSSHLNAEMVETLLYAMDCNMDEKGNGKLEGALPWDFLKREKANAKTTRDVVREAHGKKRYDGVIFKNVVDAGNTSKIKADDLYVAFYPEQIKSVNNTTPTSDPDIMYQERSTEDISNRGLLAKALETAAKDGEEKNLLRNYKTNIRLIEAEQKKLSEIKDKLFAKGSKIDPEERKKLQFEMKQTSSRINSYDRQLLKLEAMQPIQKVLTREKEMAKKRQKQKDMQLLADYKEKSKATVRELLERNQESRKKAIEGREKTFMRHKIKGVVNDLNQLLLKGTKDKHVMIGLQKAVASALDAVNMDTVGADERVAKYDALIAKAKDPDVIASLTETRDRIAEQGDKMSEKLTSLKSAYAEIKNSNDPLIANSHDEVIENKIESVVSSVGNTPLRDMTLEQLEDVYDLYTMVLTTIRNSNKAFKMDKTKTIAILGNNIMGEIDSVAGEKQYTVKALEGLKSFGWSSLKPTQAFETIGSGTFKTVFENVRAGEDTWAVDVNEAREYYREKTSKYGYDSWDFKQRFEFTSKSGKKFFLSLEQIMSLYAYSKRKQADLHLEQGGFVFDEAIEVSEKKMGIPIKYKVNTATAYSISKEELGNIVGTLSDRQRFFVDEMQAYLSDVMGAKGNEVSLEMYGVKLFKEQFYFPLKSAKQFMFEQNEVAGEVRIKNSGFSKETVAKANNPIILSNFMDVWSKHVNDMSMYHAFVLPLEDFNRVFNYKTPASDKYNPESVKSYLQNAYGTQPVAYIKQLITDLNGGARSDASAGFVNKGISLFKKGAVFASASVVIQQPSAIARAFAYINPKYFVTAKVDLAKHSKDWEECKQYAPVARIKEMGYFDTNLGPQTTEWITAKEYKGFKAKLKGLKDSNYRDEILSKAPALADEITWTHIWNAVKKEIASTTNLKVGSEEFLKKAGERFTEVVVNTQVYDSVLTRSGLMRSKDTGVKMATAFMAEPTTSLNMIVNAFVQSKRGNKKLARNIVGGVASSIILNSILVSLVYAARDDDEDETYAEKYLGSLTSELIDGFNPITYIPFAKDIWSIAQGYDVERSDMSVYSKLWQSFEELFDENKSVVEKVTDFSGSVATLFGLPLKNIMRDVEMVINTVTNKLGLSDTTKAGVGYSISDALRNSVPLVGRFYEEDTKAQKLYDAILGGDATEIKRAESQFKDQDAIDTAIRTALRENDPRIKEAAQARIDGDISKYKSIVTSITSEGNFSQDLVVKATNAEINKINSEADDADESSDDEDESKETSIYKASDINAALESGDTSDALEVINDLVKVKTNNYIAEGEKKKDAEKKAKSSVRSSVTSYWKPLYLAAYKSKNSTEMTRIRKLLKATDLYDNVVETCQDWVKQSKKSN